MAAIIVALLLPSPIFASPSTALREYKSGKFDEALKEYEQLIQKKKDDPRLHFNAGAAAYQNHKFDEATKHFEQALLAPDLQLQERAYYNRGNTFYQLGEMNPDPSKKTEQWERSLKDYESSLKLNPQDSDAKINHEFVKQKLEELKKQQQQQQQSKNDDKQNQKQDPKQQQDQKNDQSKDDQQQKSDSQKQQDQKQDSSQQQKQSQDQKQSEQNQKQNEQQQNQQKPESSPVKKKP
jgi:Ca-activated chloride channel family protein